MFLRILVIIIFAKCAWVRAQNDQLVLVRRQDEFGDTFQCVSTDVEKAVVWDTPIEQKFARNITTTFPNTKQIQLRLIDVEKSLKSAYGPVTDSRWENFPTVFTDGALTFKLLKEIYVFGTFQIPISVRTEGGANIYICTGVQYPSDNSMCYWIILGGWGGTKNALRKCKRGEIPKSDTVPSKDCKTILDENEENILNATNFVHFVIQFESISQTISLVVLGQNSSLLSYSEKHFRTYMSFNSVWVNSRNYSGFWKIHDYDYYTMRGDSRELIMSTYTSTFCISMYVALCEACTLSIELIDSTTVLEREYPYNKNVIWQRILFKYTGKDSLYKLHATIYPLSVSARVAFHNIVLSTNCFNNELKYSTLTLQAGDLEKTTCKFLMSEGQITSNPVTNVAKLDLSCPLGSIGPKCVNCSDLANQCRHSQICQYQNNNEICYCSAGYTNEQCKNHCPVNTYGINCQHKCGRCRKVTCDFVTGFCPDECDYEDAHCNKTSNPVLRHAPRLLGKCYRICLFEIIPYAGAYDSDFYKIIYKSPTETAWQFVGNKSISETRFIIESLNVSTEYTVAVLLCRAGQPCYADKAPKLNFATSCLEIQRKDITEEVNDNSAYINIKITSSTCPLKQYYLRIISGESLHYNNTVTQRNTIDGINPNTQYNYFITNVKSKYKIYSKFPIYEIEFTDLTGAGFNSSSTEIYVYWEKPENISERILGYDVRIQHRSYKQCNDRRNKSIEFSKFVTGTNVSFKGLAPYSLYYVSITTSTKNSKSVGDMNADTKASDILLAEGYNISTRATARELTIDLATDCAFVFSPFLINIWINCSKAYCSNSIKASSNDSYWNWTISDLAPFTEYLFYSRVENSFQKSLQLPVISFKTQPDVPNPVRHFEHYGISDQGIYFRFNTPYPPTGEIEKYNFNVSIREGNKYTFYNNLSFLEKYSTRCEIWYWMRCFIMSIFKYDTHYNFQLAAKNKNIFGWSNNTDLEVHTITGRPDPPKNVKIFWDEANNQILQWEHPNKMNGHLSYFTINLGETNYKYSPPRYNLTYNFQIEYKPDAIRDYLSAKAVTLGIRCVNVDNKVSPATKSVWYYPPPIPEFANSSTFNIIANQTVSVDIPKILKQAGNSSLYIIVAKVKLADDPKPYKSEYKLIQDWISPPPEFTLWIAKEYKLTPEVETIHAVIGTGEKTISTRTGKYIFNWAIQPENIIQIYLVALNERKEFRRHNVYILEVKYGRHDTRLYFLLLLLVIPIILLIYFARKYNACARYSMYSARSTVEELQTFPLFSKRVNINVFEDYVKESIANGELARQHELFFEGEQDSNEYEEILVGSTAGSSADLTASEARNKLAKCLMAGCATLDYTHAKYIKGFECSKAYIVLEDPKSHTINGYWRIVWKENVTHIIMLAYCHKNEQYWPNYHETVNDGEVNVRHVSTEVFADYDIRHFILKQSDEEREVKQLHFTTWPDYGVPLYPQSLVPFLKRILPHSHGSAPILIHCSADAGKTSTIVLIDICLRMASYFGYVNVFYKQELLREQYDNMIGTLEQYKLAHLVILECLHSPVTGIICDENFEKAMKRMVQRDLQSYMKYIERSAWQENAISVNKHIERQVYPDKDRYSGKFVEDYGIISLPLYPASDEASSYINAAAVDGFRSPKRFIATQDPLPNTVGDFWRLVVNNDVSVIVCLQKIDTSDPTYCQFWPNIRLNVVHATPIIEVHYLNTENMEQFEVVTVSLHYKEEQRKITLIILNNWNQDEPCASNKGALLALWQEMNHRCWHENKIVVTCRNGILASGLYLAMCFTLEKIKLEQMCDVCQAVRVIRRSRRQFVQSKEQYVALHEIVFLYLNDFKLYSNFSTKK